MTKPMSETVTTTPTQELVKRLRTASDLCLWFEDTGTTTVALDIGPLCDEAANALEQAPAGRVTDADALSQTIPRTTDEGIPEPELLAAVEQAVRQRLADLYIMEAPPSAIRDALARTAALAAIAAMRRVSKTDEGRNAVIEECARVCDELDKHPIVGFHDAEDCAVAIRALTTGGK